MTPRRRVAAVPAPCIHVSGFFEPECAVSACGQSAVCWFAMPCGMLSLCDRHKAQFVARGVVAEGEGE